jgi:hypothetical protein
MKECRLFFSDGFSESPLSGFMGVRDAEGLRPKRHLGTLRTPTEWLKADTSVRRRWCRLNVTFDGVTLVFSTPQELDHFTGVIGENPLPSVASLTRGYRVGLRNTHWLSRLPAGMKSAKVRKALLAYIARSKTVADFRGFYADSPVRYVWTGPYYGLELFGPDGKPQR